MGKMSTKKENIHANTHYHHAKLSIHFLAASLIIIGLFVLSSQTYQGNDLTGAATSPVEVMPVKGGYSYGYISVSSTPSGAAIYLNGAYQGLTSKIIKVKAGTYSLKLTKSGYKDYTQSNIYVGKGQTVKIIATLQPIVTTGNIYLNSNPTGAKAYVDNIYRGTTPLTVYSLASGYHYLKVTLDGYKNWSNTTYVNAGYTTSVIAYLEQEEVVQPNSCTDSDGGLNYYAIGYIDAWAGGPEPIHWYDFCSGNGLTLTEYYCDGTTPTQTSKSCNCLNGACVNETNTTGSLTINTAPVYYVDVRMYPPGYWYPPEPLTTTAATGQTTLGGLQPGTYNILLSKDGYKDFVTQGVTIQANQNTILTHAMVLNTTTNTTQFNCTDSDNGLNYYTFGWVSGYQYGDPYTHYDSCSLGSGYLYEMACNATGEYYSKPYLCPNGCNENNVCINATNTTGTLGIHSTPTGAKFYLYKDLTPVAGWQYILTGYTTHYATNLQQGNYRVDISKEGYNSWAGTKTVIAGQTTDIYVTLQANNSCRDSDNLNYYNKGYVAGSENGEQYSRWDECEPGTNWVNEFYCNGNNWSSTIYDCPSGCSDGACQNQTNTTNTMGPFSPGIIGTSQFGPSSQAWSTPTYAAYSDNQFATVVLPKQLYQESSNWLEAKSFGFTIPTGAIIQGIMVGIERKASAPNSINDNAVHLMYFESPIAGPRYSSFSWPTDDNVFQKYGGPDDLWGYSFWSPSMINHPDFGVKFAAMNNLLNSTNATATAYVDAITLEIWYTN